MLNISTDNKNIVTDTPITSSRLQRWKLLLTEFNCKISFIAGKDNGTADVISRLSLIRKNPFKDILYSLDFTHLLGESLNQQEIYKYNLKPHSYNGQEIYVDTKQRVFMGNETGKIFLKKIHDEFGHPGQFIMYSTLNGYFFIPQIKKTIEAICQLCKLCKLCKTTKPQYIKCGKIQGNISTTEYMKRISIDFFGPIIHAEKEFITKYKKIWL